VILTCAHHSHAITASQLAFIKIVCQRDIVPTPIDGQAQMGAWFAVPHG
jgi:hypothetical protein